MRTFTISTAAFLLMATTLNAQTACNPGDGECQHKENHQRFMQQNQDNFNAMMQNHQQQQSRDDALNALIDRRRAQQEREYSDSLSQLRQQFAAGIAAQQRKAMPAWMAEMNADPNQFSSSGADASYTFCENEMAYPSRATASFAEDCMNYYGMRSAQ